MAKLDLTAGTGIDIREGTGTNAGKLIISNTGSSGPALIYYGNIDGDDNYYGPDTNTYLFLTYAYGGGGPSGYNVSFYIFVKTFENIQYDSSSETTNNYTVTYSPLDPRDEYKIEGTGVVSKDAELGDGTLVVNITSWKLISTAEEDEE